MLATVSAVKPVMKAVPSHEQSRTWFERAKASLAGGVSSSARLAPDADPSWPIYAARGRGAHLWDVDGNHYVDCLLSHGSVILGHADEDCTHAVTQQLLNGTMFGTCNLAEVELAEQICRMVPGTDLLRYGSSGSEAICGAIRAARGFTGKTRILKFEGHYHGWVDVLAVSNRPSLSDAGELESPASCAHSKGIPQSVVDDVIVCPWNQPKILKQILDQHERELAAIICEPIVANNACLMPVDGYLQLLRDECDKRGIVLIFDEIVTGFRIAPGGAAELFGVVPDLTVYSKAMGGGLPISAFGGRRAVMEPIAANTTKHGGTYNGNPLCAVAALQVTRTVSRPGVLQAVADAGRHVMEAIRRSASDLGIPVVVQGLGSMFQVLFTDTQPTHYRQVIAADTRRFLAMRSALLSRGVMINASGLACWFFSTAHGQDEIHEICEAVDSAMRVVA